MAKKLIKSIPFFGSIATKVYGLIKKRHRPSGFDSSRAYWERRYASGGSSGVGSYHHLAEFKAEVINKFVSDHQIKSVIEFGSGDGNQLTLANYPNYLGLDVSNTAILFCRERFQNDDTKRFCHLSEYNGETAELTLSLDVIYHLIEDTAYFEHMDKLFRAAERFVIIYANDTDETPEGTPPHVKFRKFTDWVAAYALDWQLLDHIPNRYPLIDSEKTGSFADFFIYGRTGRDCNSE